jgi:DNA-binding GntR family transcriptional regulator
MQRIDVPHHVLSGSRLAVGQKLLLANLQVKRPRARPDEDRRTMAAERHAGTKHETPAHGAAVDRVVSAIRLMIASNELSPGEQLRQEEMAERLGLSRVPVREGLRLLSEQGLLDHHPNRGYFVARRAPVELAQIVRMLDLFENELMSNIEWPDDTLLAELEAMNEQMRGYAEAEDWTPLLAINRAFHFKIFSLSPWKLMLNELQRLWTLADPLIAGKLWLVEARRRTIAEHEQLIAALRRRDRQECMTALDQHRSGTRAALLPVAQHVVVPRSA